MGVDGQPLPTSDWYAARSHATYWDRSAAASADTSADVRAAMLPEAAALLDTITRQASWTLADCERASALVVALATLTACARAAVQRERTLQ
jgi:hypothetical protein